MLWNGELCFKVSNWTRPTLVDAFTNIDEFSSHRRNKDWSYCFLKAPLSAHEQNEDRFIGGRGCTKYRTADEVSVWDFGNQVTKLYGEGR